MAASEHLNPKLFMTAKELMDTTAGYDAEDWSVPFSKSKINPSFQGYSHVLATHEMESLPDIKRAENAVPHDEGMFGTDYSTINEGETLTNSIKRQGVKNPVNLSFSKDSNRWVMMDGQHRAVAAHDVNPDMYIPLSYNFKDNPDNLKDS